MFKRNSLITRIAIGKIVGFAIGLMGFVFLIFVTPEAPLMLRWGVLLWYITLGAIIGVYGVFTWHPILRLPMPWWFRAPMIGAWMNFVLTLFAYDQFNLLMISVLGNTDLFTSPFWFVLEGAIIGLLIGFLATLFGGEGKEIVDENL